MKLSFSITSKKYINTRIMCDAKNWEKYAKSKDFNNKNSWKQDSVDSLRDGEIIANYI